LGLPALRSEGFVLIAVIHAVAILTTFVAILTDGRPLR
jgi:hypothetical protein